MIRAIDGKPGEGMSLVALAILERVKPAELRLGFGCWYLHCAHGRKLVHYPLPETAAEKRA